MNTFSTRKSSRTRHLPKGECWSRGSHLSWVINRLRRTTAACHHHAGPLSQQQRYLDAFLAGSIETLASSTFGEHVPKLNGRDSTHMVYFREISLVRCLSSGSTGGHLEWRVPRVSRGSPADFPAQVPAGQALGGRMGVDGVCGIVRTSVIERSWARCSKPRDRTPTLLRNDRLPRSVAMIPRSPGDNHWTLTAIW
jgi:hypothetical protein